MSQSPEAPFLEKLGVPVLDEILSVVPRTHHWRKGKNGPYFAKDRDTGARLPLTMQVIKEALHGGLDPFGVALLEPGSTVVRFAVLDMDAHAEAKDEPPVAWPDMQAHAKRLIEAGERVGVRFIPFRSTGGSGIHLYALWSEPQDARSVRVLLGDVLHSCGFKNGTKGVVAGEVEVFPKQDAVGEESVGNMVVPAFFRKARALKRSTLAEIPAGMQKVLYSDPVPLAPPDERPVAAPAPAGDADFARVRSALMHLDPNTLDYDQWWKLGAALHHGTGGSEAGRAVFHDWSSRFSRYDPAETDKQWNAYKTNKPGGITVNTLFSSALKREWDDPDRTSGLGFIADEPEPMSPAEVEAERVRLQEVFLQGEGTEADARALAALPDDVQRDLIDRLAMIHDDAERRARAALKKAQASSAAVVAHPGAMDKRMPIQAFPYTRKTKAGPVPTNHSANYVALLDYYGIAISYDVIEKEIRVTINGQPLPRSDHEGEVVLRRATDLCVLNGVPVDGLQSTLTALGAAHEVNPVVDVLSKLKWDGKPRFAKLAAAVGASDQAAAGVAFRIFLIQACAAADGGERGMRANPDALPKYETVIVLQGEQGVGKTSGLRRLLPARLRGYFQDGVTLAIGDRDSERQGISGWISELGELEATFRRSEIERLKAFLSKREDRLRVAYGRTDSRFKRRTMFVASANSDRVLTDLTGSRRFAVLSVSTMDIGWTDDEIDQLWAEAWHRYCQGEQWWPTEPERVVMVRAAEQFEVASSFEERLAATFDWEQGLAGVREVKRSTVTATLDLVSRNPVQRNYSPHELTQAGETIKRLWRRHGAKNVNGKLSIKVLDQWRAVHAKDGRSYGYLLPPMRDQGGGDPATGGLL